MKVKNKNPFSLGELGRLFDARMGDDLEYLKEWSKKAASYYEAEKGRLYEIIENQSLTSKAKNNE